MIIIDIEATCWKDDEEFQEENTETIEIGAVRLNEDMTEILDGFQSCIRPVIHPALTDFCIELTGIQQEEVDSAPLFKSVWEEQFVPWVGDEVKFGSWGNFDLGLLKKDCERASSDFPFKRFCNIARTCGSRRGAMRRFGIKFEGRQHRGYDDAKNGADLFIASLKVWKKHRFWDV